MSEELALTGTTGNAVEIKVPGSVQSDGAIVNYVTFQTNKPLTNANNLYVWQTTSGNVPWGSTPDGSTAIAQDDPTGTQFLSFPFQVQTGYVIGYGVAADPNTVCSTVSIPADTYNDPSTYVTTDTTLSINSFGRDYVQVKLAGLPDYSPSANANWVGVWKTDHVPYSGDPLAKATVSLGSSSGMIYIGGVPVTIGSTYTVGYFMGKVPAGRTALACSATFST